LDYDDEDIIDKLRREIDNKNKNIDPLAKKVKRRSL